MQVITTWSASKRAWVALACGLVTFGLLLLPSVETDRTPEWPQRVLLPIVFVAIGLLPVWCGLAIASLRESRSAVGWCALSVNGVQLAMLLVIAVMKVFAA